MKSDSRFIGFGIIFYILFRGLGKPYRAWGVEFRAYRVGAQFGVGWAACHTGKLAGKRDI